MENYDQISTYEDNTIDFVNLLLPIIFLKLFDYLDCKFETGWHKFLFLSLRKTWLGIDLVHPIAFKFFNLA